MWACLQRLGSDDSILTRHQVNIPRTMVISSAGFDDFVSKNHFSLFRNVDDEQIADLFLDAELPTWLSGNWKFFLKNLTFRCP
jgi:hypothetical protein